MKGLGMVKKDKKAPKGFSAGASSKGAKKGMIQPSLAPSARKGG